MATGPLPLVIKPGDVGHIDHHELIHKFIDDNYDLGAWRATVDAALAGISKPVMLYPMSAPGTLVANTLSQLKFPVVAPGTILRVDLTLGATATAFDVLITVNYQTIWSGAHPMPHFGAGVNQVSATPDPAKNHVNAAQGSTPPDFFSMHTQAMTGGPATDLVGVVVVAPD